MHQLRIQCTVLYRTCRLSATETRDENFCPLAPVYGHHIECTAVYLVDKMWVTVDLYHSRRTTCGRKMNETKSSIKVAGHYAKVIVLCILGHITLRWKTLFQGQSLLFHDLWYYLGCHLTNKIRCLNESDFILLPFWLKLMHLWSRVQRLAWDCCVWVVVFTKSDEELEKRLHSSSINMTTSPNWMSHVTRTNLRSTLWPLTPCYATWKNAWKSGWVTLDHQDPKDPWQLEDSVTSQDVRNYTEHKQR